MDELSFIVGGEAFNQVRAWQQACDQAVIRLELARRGSTRVVYGGKKPRLEVVRTLPKPGQAEPFYGPQGGGYRYTFSSCVPAGTQMQACLLQVENTALERIQAQGYMPLELALGAPGAAALEAVSPEKAPPDMAPPDAAANPPDPGGTLDLDDPEVLRRVKAALAGSGRQVTEMHFVIDADLLNKLAAWPRWGRAYAEYAFIFRPLSTGTDIRVRYQPQGEVFVLSDG